MALTLIRPTLERRRVLVAAATTVAFTATAAAAFAAVLVTMVMTVTAAATVFTVIVVMIVRAVNMAVGQFFFSRFTNRNNFYVKFQILTSQHVVTINHNMIVFHFGNFYRYRTLVGFRQETHTYLQFINAHKDVFRHALHQIFIILTVSVVCANSNIKFVANFMAFQRGFQARNQGAVAVQVIQRRTHRRLINQHTVFCTYLIGQADHQVFCYFHDIS
ncbi:hypothetical protein SARI_04171 [Salmonella enterica subsp. arizonae serovar 62:z4,z23:-]|uniref:Uncharacterized protein n=1 Tax=Salmonella arizonae (strain ATCC BAA-731 / CDC346-86 / RSK2980) TaxID=41514 RepID=A9MN29_SALAR|nr:hypothetical protein SARI_04171 [Salmonella enterica subsp. arizonae serovar 62:z4,z23:-]